MKSFAQARNRATLAVMPAILLAVVCAAPTGLEAGTNWDSTARIMAGLSLPKSDPLYKVTQTRTFRAHSRYMNRFWGRVNRESTALIRAWQPKHLPSAEAKNRAIYPLSGADFVNLYAMYPQAESYLMFALESPGRTPAPRDLRGRRLRSGLFNLRQVIHSVATKNYFYSASMRKHMKHTSIPGTTPALMVFITRLGLKITDIEPVYIDAAGKVQDRNAGARLERGAVAGMRFKFDRPDGTKSSLLYLQIRIGKRTVDPATRTGKFFATVKNYNAMMKSAIYLLFNNKFAGLRDHIVKNSRLIVQDDTGVPFRFFKEDTWNIKLYGHYVTYTFRIRGIGYPPKQKDLIARYKQGKIPGVRFQFGYGSLSSRYHSTLMVLHRK